MLFTVFPLIYVLYFEEFLIHDSRGCWACAIFRSIPNLQARTDGRTDRQMNGQTDKLIWVRLGNLRFLQVNLAIHQF